MRGQHVGDRLTIGQADVGVGVDPFRTQPLHLGAPLIDFERPVTGCGPVLGAGTVLGHPLVALSFVVLVLCPDPVVQAYADDPLINWVACVAEPIGAGCR